MTASFARRDHVANDHDANTDELIHAAICLLRFGLGVKPWK